MCRLRLGAMPAAAPLELAAVLVLVSLELGPAAAFAGIATMLAVIPIQAWPSCAARRARACTACCLWDTSPSALL